MTDTNTEKRTATQRIEDLERVVATLYTTAQQLVDEVNRLSGSANDVPLIKEALKILNRKCEAIVRSATPETGITDSAVSAILIQLNTVDLQNQVAGYLASGQIAAAEDVKENGYLVCEENNSNGEITNPRIQFRLDSQNTETQALLLGKKPGESVSFGDGKYGVKILETYTLRDPNLAAPVAGSTDAATASAPEAAASAETQASEAATPVAPVADTTTATA